MADENQFKVELGADSSQLKAALNDAFKSVQDFAIRVSKLPQVAFSTQGIDNYKKSVAQLKSEVNQLSLQNLNRELININSTVAKANLEGVRIRIDADTGQLQKSLTFATTEIGKLRAERITIAADIKPLEASLSKATQEVQDFAISVRKIPQVAFSTGGIDNYKKSVAQLKSEVANLNLDGFARDLVTVNTAAARANLDTIKITVEGNTLPLQKALTAATGLVDQFGVSAIRTSNQTESSFQSIAASAVSLQASLKSIPNAFDQIESGSTNLSNVKTALDSAAGNAIKASGTFERFGQQASAAFSEAGAAAARSATGYEVVGKSINDLHSDLARLTRELQTATNPADVDRLKNSILQINTALGNVKAQGRLDIIDPKTTVELNSASTALSNMGRTAGAALSGINESLDTASGKALQAANTFEGFGQRIVSAISQFSATRGSLNQITAAINEAELAAQQAGKSFLNIGVSVPNKQIDLLRNNVATLKAELASGFRPIINVVDPKTPALLNSVSAALVNIGPATDVVSAALVRTGSNLSAFSVTVNKSLSDSVRSFDVFKTQATQLGAAFDKIPVSVRPIDTSSITAFKEAVERLKADISGLQFKGALQDTGAPLSSINEIKGAVEELKREMATGTKVPITINSAPILKSLSELQSQLRGFQTQLQNATDPNTVDRLNKAIAQTNAQIKTLKGTGITYFTGLQKSAAASAVAVSNVGRSLHQVKPGATAAGQSMTDLNRIVQDVPFGFIGIQNNIQPLFDSFSRLKAETGSAKTAFKALAGSLIGPAGIGLAIAAASAAFLIFQNGIQGFNRKTKEAADKAKEFNDTLRSTSQIVDEAFGSVEGQVANISALAKAVQDSNKPYSERQRALEDLKKVNKEYFGDLTLEAASLATLTSRVNEYTNALVAQAVVKGFSDEISKVSTELRGQNKELDITSNKLNRLRTELAATSQEETSLTGESRISEKYVKLRSVVQDTEKVFKTQRDQVEKLGGSFVGLQADMEKAVNETLKFKSTDPLKTQTEGTKKGDLVLQAYNKELEFLNTKLADTDRLRQAGLLSLEREREALIDQLKVFDLLRAIDAKEVQLKLKPKLEIDPSLFQIQITQAFEDYQARLRTIFAKPVEFIPQFEIGNLDFFEKLSKAVKNQAESQEIGINIPLNISITGESNVTAVFDKIKQDINKVSLGDAFRPMITNFQKSAESAKSEIETGLTATFSELEIEQSITSALTNVGAALGKAISEGASPFAAAAEAFLQTIGAVVAAFGERIIALAVAMQVTKEAIKKSFDTPAIAIAAGVALVILGGILKNIKFNVPGAAQGGILTGPSTGYLAMLHGTEMVTPIGKVPEMMGRGLVTETFHTIRGSELHLLIKTYEKERGRM